MKLIKIASFLIALLLLISVMSGCRLAPTSETWYLSSYKKPISFIGGVERNFGFALASDVYPFAYADLSSVTINFTADGNVDFVAWDGEHASGTFTYEHVGNYTNVYMNFDNGEKVEGSSIKKLSGEKYLVFVYKDVTYTFTTYLRGVSLTLDEIVEIVKNGESESLYEATVTKQEDMFVAQFSEMISYKIAADTAAYAIEIHADGTYTVLDALKEGKVLSTYNESANYIVLYYIEDAE